jgi:hypothetical protein
MSKLHFRLVQHVSTQLGHIHVRHCYKEFLLHCFHGYFTPPFALICTNQYKTHGRLSKPPQQQNEAANANGGVKYP